MADPKYADLPGIAYDQPDVYETLDLPESDQTIEFYEEENESIETLHISASEAFNKFKGKYLNSKGVDFSEKVSRKLRTGYDARSGDWELVGEGEKETPLQKFQRLQCEMHELMEEINELKTVTKTEDPPQDMPLASQVQQAEKILADLCLEETLGTELISNLSDPQGTQLKKLFNLLEQFKQTTSDGSKSTGDKPKSTKTTELAKDIITYKLEYRPEQAKLAQSSRLGDLEHRLHRLETTLGNSSDKLSRLTSATNQSSILETVQYLTAKCSVLDSTQLDHIEGRLIALTQKMNTLSQQRNATAEDAALEQQVLDLFSAMKKIKAKSTNTDDAEIHQMTSELYENVKRMVANSTPHDVDKVQKINELYNFVKKVESLSELLPQTVERLVALNAFHQQAVEFSNSLTQLEDLQNQISSGVQNNKALLQGVQESFALNLDTINKNIVALNKRVEALKK